MISRLLTFPDSDSFFLFGPRQTGKTTLTNRAYQDNCWNINLLQDDIFLKYTKNPGLFRLHVIEKVEKNGTSTIIVDEIQRSPQLLNDIQSLIDNYPKLRFVLTGSSARKLKQKSVNLLGGRAVERRLFPYVYAEIATDFNLEDALRFGTLPGIFSRSKESKRERLRAYVNTYLREEIRQEGLLRNLGGFSRFLDIAASQNSELVNYSDIARDCQISSHTVRAHYDILEDTLIAFPLKPWVKSARKRMTGHPKYYFFDLGVLNAINNRLDADFEPGTKGRLFESLVVLELYRYLNYAQSEASIYFWRTNAGAEVDIIIEKHGRIIAACEVKSGNVIDNKDLSGLRSFKEEFPDVPLYIACLTNEPYTRNGVRILNWISAVNEMKSFF
jgi:predicted AAA+ superfamily ATPase